MRPHGADRIIPFDEVFEYVYRPNVKEFLAEAESVTLHTLRQVDRSKAQENHGPNTDANPKDIFD